MNVNINKRINNNNNACIPAHHDAVLIASFAFIQFKIKFERIFLHFPFVFYRYYNDDK